MNAIAEQAVVAAAMAAETQHTDFIPLNQLYVGSYNPRTEVKKDAEWDEFVASIKAQGINQPILVRPVEGKTTPYEIVAGQRRFLACLELYSQDFAMPCLVRSLTDEQALAAATSENFDRAAMTPVQSARAAAKMVAQCNGDRAEACKRLGWRMETLKDRLKLMSCIEDVLTAVEKDKLALGAAELLAGLSAADQKALLDEFLEKGVPSINDIKAIIQQKSCKLEGAIFNKEQCGACVHNSAQQRQMFGSMVDGYCLNGTCYQAKTEDELTKRQGILKETWARVEIIREGEHLRVLKVTPELVGEDQYNACKNCNNFGAGISAIPRSLGQVAKPICLDHNCFDEKVKARKAAIAAASAPVQNAPADAGGNAAGKAAGKAAAAPGTAATKAKAAAAPGQDGKPGANTSIVMGSGILEFRDDFYRKVVIKELSRDPGKCMQFLLSILLNNKGQYLKGAEVRQLCTSSKLLADEVKSSYCSVHDQLVEALTFEPGRVQKTVALLGLTAVSSLSREELVGSMLALAPDMNAYFNLNSDLGRKFLDKLTKGQIETVCKELGIDVAMGKTFASVMTGKKDELIKQVTNVQGFDYVGKVPNLLKPDFKTK